MTRRDTIISAALINAGLLVVLFVCALGIDDGVQANAHSLEMTPAVHTTQAEAPATPAQNLLVSDSNSQIQEIALEHSVDRVEQSASRIWTTIEVQRGDRVDKIAARYQMSVEELLQANELQTTQLVVGQKLKVLALSSAQTSLTATRSSDQLPAASAPNKVVKAQTKSQTKPVASAPIKREGTRATSKASAQEAKPSSSKNVAKSTESGAQYHYVQRGESPWVIAKKYGMTTERLLKLNNLDEVTARRLREGDRLRVR